MGRQVEGWETVNVETAVAAVWILVDAVGDGLPVDGRRASV
jgi:hypothetical protein